MNDDKNIHFKNNPEHHQKKKKIFILRREEPPQSMWDVGLLSDSDEAETVEIWRHLCMRFPEVEYFKAAFALGVKKNHCLVHTSVIQSLKNCSRYRSRKATLERSCVGVCAAAPMWPQCRDKANESLQLVWYFIQVNDFDEGYAPVIVLYCLHKLMKTHTLSERDCSNRWVNFMNHISI